MTEINQEGKKTIQIKPLKMDISREENPLILLKECTKELGFKKNKRKT